MKERPQGADLFGDVLSLYFMGVLKCSEHIPQIQLLSN